VGSNPTPSASCARSGNLDDGLTAVCQTSVFQVRLETEKCESGRIDLTANEGTGETGSEGSNPSFSASVEGPVDGQQYQQHK
jgi:hypothetical protein